MLRNSLGDADGEGDLGLESLFDTGGGQGRALVVVSITYGSRLKSGGCSRIRDEKRSSGSSRLLDGLGDVLEDGQVEMCLASLLGVCSTDDLGS
jgi:hypothetical protein